jgi:hypothetical protein
MSIERDPLKRRFTASPRVGNGPGQRREQPFEEMDKVFR